MVNGGFLAAGYEYIIIDDCWLAKNRTYEGKLQPDAIRFPSGIKNIADYVIIQLMTSNCSHPCLRYIRWV